LFESLVFNLPTLAARICDVESAFRVLDRSSESGAASIDVLGYVRYLEVASRFDPAVSSPAKVDHYAHYQKFIHRCSNLIVYKHFPRGEFVDLPPSFFCGLLRTTGATLRRLEIVNATIPQDFPHLLTTLAANLEYLHLFSIFADCKLPGGSVHHIISLPNLHTLHLEPHPGLSNAIWEAPSLGHLGIAFLEPERTGNHEHVLPFVEYPLHLKRLDIRIQALQNLGHIISSFPELEQIRVCHDGFSRHEASLKSHTAPSVREFFLDIYVDEDQYPNVDLVREVDATLEVLLDSEVFPSLEKITLACDELGQVGESWRGWHERFVARGVKLDGDGPWS
jgi:hypothetical protein